MVSAPAYTLQAPHDTIDLFKYQPETVGPVGTVGARDVTSLITIQMFPPSHADYGGYLLPPFLPPSTPPPCTLHSLSMHINLWRPHTALERLERLPVTGLVFATIDWLTD